MFKEKNQLDEVKVFKDPVHQYVRVTDKVIWDLIATAEFQRLRRIKQLGTTFFTFHGAEHSRFNHSLGVYEIRSEERRVGKECGSCREQGDCRSTSLKQN